MWRGREDAGTLEASPEGGAQAASAAPSRRHNLHGIAVRISTVPTGFLRFPARPVS